MDEQGIFDTIVDHIRIFIYDSAKSSSNRSKHGIDFEEAKQLWDDSNAIGFRTDRRGERRYGIIARYAGSTWCAIYTYRGKAVRIISVRRATDKERSHYDQRANRRGV